MALTEERAACLFWAGTICAFLFTILYSSFCILKIRSVGAETCAFLEIGTVASVLAFIVGMGYYCYKQKFGMPVPDDFYTHWTVSRPLNYRHKTETVTLSPVANDDTPSDFECSICSEGTEQMLVVQLNCSHYFHKTCIQRWFKSDHHMSCPLCRTSQLETRIAGREKLVFITIIPPSSPDTQSEV